MEKTYNISLNLDSKNWVFPLFRVVQGDNITRKIVAALYDANGDTYTPGTGVTAEYWSQKPDKTGTSHSATLSGSTVTITLTEQDTAAVGDVYATVKLVKDEEVLSAIPFRFKVEAFPTGDNVPSTSDYQTLVEATEAAAQATADAIEATEAAEQATEYATDAADTASNYNIDLLAEGYDATAIYVKGDYTIYQGALYRCLTDIVTPEAWTASHWVAVELGADVQDAWRDATEGYSDTLTAGDLTSDEYTEDTEPYLFRRTFNGANNHEMDTLVGGTIAWNQLVDEYTTKTFEGITTSYNSTTHKFKIKNDSRTANYNSGSSQNTLVAMAYVGHVYFAPVSPVIVGVGTTSTSTSRINQVIFKQEGTDYPIYLRVDKSYDFVTVHPVGDETEFYLNVFDLTAMFGSTIADAVYAMEQAESGSGVAWFRKYFPESYYAYDSGTLMSVEAVAHRMVGKNLFPRPYAQKGNTNHGINYTIQDDGTIIANGTASGGNASLILIDNTAYDFKRPIIVDGCPSGGSSSTYRVFVISEQGASTQYDTGNGVTIQQGTIYRYVIVIYSGYTANNLVFKPMIRYADETDTSFEPVKRHTYKLDQTLTLRGISKLVDGKLTYDGDTYEPSGQVVRRYHALDLGSLTWAKSSSGNKFYATVPSQYAYPRRRTDLLMVCAKYTFDGWGNASVGYYGDDKTIRYQYQNNDTPYAIELYIHDEAYSTASALQTALSDSYIVYELATPTTETASPYEPTQVVYADGTEEYISNNIVPVGHNTRYPVSIKQALTQIAKAPSTNGTYILKCVVTDGVASYSWVTE